MLKAQDLPIYGKYRQVLVGRSVRASLAPSQVQFSIVEAREIYAPCVGVLAGRRTEMIGKKSGVEWTLIRVVEFYDAKF